jgi:hypothetical protein
VLRKRGREKARSVRAMCDVCAAHGDRTAVGVDVDTQGSSLREDETRLLLNARVECHALVLERILSGPGWFALALRRGDGIPWFPDEKPEGKENAGKRRCREFTLKAPRGASHIKDA